MSTQTMWSFKTKGFTVQWMIQPDYDMDTSFDETGETSEKIATGEWEAFISEIKVIHNDTGLVIGEDSIRGNIYANPQDFRDHIGMNKKGHGSYFSDLVRGAIANARSNINALSLSMRTVGL